MPCCNERTASNAFRIALAGTVSPLEPIDAMDRWNHTEGESQSNHGDFTHRLVVQPKSPIRSNTLRACLPNAWDFTPERVRARKPT
jgi:hypothetical protein